MFYGLDGLKAGQYSILAERQYFIHEWSGFAFGFAGWRYSRLLDRLFRMTQDIVGNWSLHVTDPVGGLVATGDDVGSVLAAMGTACLVDGSTASFYISFTDDQQLFAYMTDTADTVTLTYDSGVSWGGYANFQCLAPGEVRGSDFDIWLCADDDLVKLTFSMMGTLKASTVVATLSDDLRYAVYDAGFVVVWTDAAHVVRINAATGASVYEKTVPYQIQAVFSSRDLGDPDLQRLTTELYFVASSISYFTDLETGITRSVTGATHPPDRQGAAAERFTGDARCNSLNFGENSRSQLGNFPSWFHGKSTETATTLVLNESRALDCLRTMP